MRRAWDSARLVHSWPTSAMPLAQDRCMSSHASLAGLGFARERLAIAPVSYAASCAPPLSFLIVSSLLLAGPPIVLFLVSVRVFTKHHFPTPGPGRGYPGGR